jgi:hypothetical protein
MQVIETGFTVTAIVLLAVLIRAVFVYFSPYRECRWCRGRRLGARQVHKVKLSLLQAWDEMRQS